MRILLTNDDGVFAPGIQMLGAGLREIADVVVAAPSMEQSGASHSITVHDPIRVDAFDMPQMTAWRIGGTPADCVKLALVRLMDEKPDFVISGINQGANLGTDVLYSGTVSAAREGAMHDIPSIAISLDAHCQPDFSQAALFMKTFLPRLQQKTLPKNLLLNVNVPHNWQCGGCFRFTELGVRKYENTFEKRVDPRGRSYYWMSGTPLMSANAADTDVAVVEKGEISITPIHFELTDQHLLSAFQAGEFLE